MNSFIRQSCLRIYRLDRTKRICSTGHESSELNNFTSWKLLIQVPHIFRNTPCSKASCISQLSSVPLRYIWWHPKLLFPLPSRFSLAPKTKVSSKSCVNQKDENWLWDACAAMLISPQLPSSAPSILHAIQAPAITNWSGKHLQKWKDMLQAPANYFRVL